MITMKETEILNEMFEDKYRELNQKKMRQIMKDDNTPLRQKKIDDLEKIYKTLSLLEDKFINMGMLSE